MVWLSVNLIAGWFGRGEASLGTTLFRDGEMGEVHGGGKELLWVVCRLIVVDC